MHVPTKARSLSAVLVLGISLVVTGVPTQAAAAGTYSAALSTAVAALPVEAENNAGYDRDAQFGDWVDVDGDCQNTRHEVLIAESHVEPRFSSTGCTVTAGQWTTIYDGQTYTSPSEVDIDHMVPVAEAWGSGAQSWTQQRRVAFYNDLGYEYSLNAMPSALNQSKAADGPEQWLPPTDQCRYIVAWTAVKLRWGLTTDSTEKTALEQQAAACPNDTVTVELAAGTAAPAPTPTTGTAPVPDEHGTKRLAGTDRYATAAAIVRDSFPTGPVPVVFIATGTAFADALAGGPAADAVGGPVLPVDPGGIPAPVLAELDRLEPGRIVILGGPNALSDAIANQLQSYTIGTVTRLAGANRYATAATVATTAFDAPVPQVVIATGTGFADALAGGAVGALTDSPVLLVAPNSLPAETAAALQALQPRDIAVLGGTSAVSDAVLQKLQGYTSGAVNRLAGADRYSTAARLAQVYWPSTTDVVYLATGRNFPDALAGVPAAGLDRAPLLLIEPSCMPTATQQEIDRLQPSTIVVLGGPATVSDAAVSGASCAPPPPTEPTPPPPTAPPAQPADRDCADFTTQAEAQAFYDFYFPYYGDFARLDGNDDGIACNNLP